MNISLELKKEGLIYDRYLGEPLSLPYSFEEIKFQPNDTISSDLVNLKFKHLYDNFIYLYQNTLLASNVIPVSCTAIAGLTASSTNFTWYRGVSSRNFAPLSNNPSLVGIDKTQTMHLIKNNDFDRYSLITSNGKSIVVFNFDSEATYISKVFTQNEVDQNYGVPFQNICDFDVYGDYLFVLDCDLNRVIKYDASGFTGLNTATNNRLLYVDSIGNYGTYIAKTDFNDPSGLTIANSSIYVLDAGNKSIKKFDTNLNWQYTHRLYKDFLSSYPVDIGSDVNGNIYVATLDFKLFVYDKNIENKKVYDLDPLLGSDEIVRSLDFSKSDSNVFYITTNKNIYKKLVNKPYSTVGKYLLYLYKYDIPDEQITSFATAPTLNLDSDRNIMFSVSGNVGKFGNFYDNLNLFDVLALRDFDIYGIDELKFTNEEYLQSWVFNKNLSKLILNHMRLRDEIIGKFIASKDYLGNIFFKGTRYLVPSELDDMFFEQDITYFIGANELITSNIVNRPFYKIYKIQEALARILGAEIIRKPSNDNPIVIG